MSSAVDFVPPGRRRRPRDRKQQILAAARELFVAQGYPNVSMAAIAQQVGITAGALYRHFDNKAVLLDQVIEESFDWLDTPMTYADYEAVVEEGITRILDRPYLTDLWVYEIRHLPEEKRRALRRRMRAWSAGLMPALRDRRPDCDPGQLELLLWAVLSLVSSIGRQVVHRPPADRVPAARAGLQALMSAQMVPTGGVVARRTPRLLPNSMRERLLYAAFQQLGERGVHETSMASIAAAVDVSGPNLYSYFESKADLVRAVYERGSHALWLGLEEALAGASDPSDALNRLTRSYIRLARSWSTGVEDPRSEGDLRERLTAFRREYFAEWVTLLVQARPELTHREARLRVHLALLIVADLYAIGGLTRIETFQENVARLVLAVLLGPAGPHTS
ncbi:TetR/AcrR family transcriptional regulator [Thermopolyspora sp. NPDC052614]|uniref:TetR/AcrR family transcriptional regulator n=1 Tax=Thermopolyspora sp. NPDC052614 TaxID=3155682 RepID=UPI003441691A